MRLFGLVFIFIFFTSLTFAQQDSLEVQYDSMELDVKDINEEHLAKYKEDRHFNYTEAVNDDNWLTKLWNWLVFLLIQFLEFIFGVGKVSGVVYSILRVIPYLLLAVLLFLLIRFFLKVNSRSILTGKQKSASVVITEEEHIIKNEDIIGLINKAIDQKNYRLAIRYSYLLVLKELSEGELIIWEQQKTNEDYIKEIKTPGIKEHFRTITRIYDYVWYGEFSIDVLKYESLKPSFDTISKSIKTA